MTDDQRAWRTVLDSIEHDLVAGALQPGDRLPGERRLASQLNVGRSSVREALRVLEAMGLIQTNSGSGPNAGAVIVARPDGGMSMLMRLQVAATGFDVEDVVRARIVLETAVVSALTSRVAHPCSTTEAAPAELGESREQLSRTADQTPLLVDAERILATMDDTSTPLSFVELDSRFHLSLAEAAGNQVVVATMAGLRGAVERYVAEGVPSLPDWTATAKQLQIEHRGILEAIRGGDAASATRLVTAHIEGYFSATSARGKTTADRPDTARSEN